MRKDGDKRSLSSIAASAVVVVILVGGIILGVLISSHSKMARNSLTNTSASSTQSSSLQYSTSTYSASSNKQVSLTSNTSSVATLASQSLTTEKGITFTPLSYNSTGIQDILNRIPALGNTFSWAGDWAQLGLTNGAPAMLAKIAQSNNLSLIIEAQFFSQSSGQLLRPLDNSTIANYTRMAVSFVQNYHPKYMAFGIEVNILYEKSPSAFDSFVTLYDQTYASVKSVSPNTIVFTIFQLEHMAGMQGGLYGGSNNASAEWSLFGRFNMDAVGFTTYPDLVFKNPNDMPSNFYSQIKVHTSLPIIFTEIGWHAAASPAGWESSPGEQAQFVTNFFGLTAGLNKIMEIWSFLYDQSAPIPFNSMGLLNTNGTARPAWDAWVSGS